MRRGPGHALAPSATELTDQPIRLPSTDSSGFQVVEAQKQRGEMERQARLAETQDATMRLAAKAAEEAARARAEAADARQTLQNAVEQRQP